MYEKARAYPTSKLLADRGDRAGTLQTGFPPLIGLRALRSQNSLKLVFGWIGLFPPTLQLRGRHLYFAARKPQESGSQRCHKATASFVNRFDIPNFCELAKCALDLKWFDILGRGVSANIALDRLPVIETERCFGQCRQIPILVPFLLRCGL